MMILHFVRTGAKRGEEVTVLLLNISEVLLVKSECYVKIHETSLANHRTANHLDEIIHRIICSDYSDRS